MVLADLGVGQSRKGGVSEVSPPQRPPPQPGSPLKAGSACCVPSMAHGAWFILVHETFWECLGPGKLTSLSRVGVLSFLLKDFIFKYSPYPAWALNLQP